MVLDEYLEARAIIADASTDEFRRAPHADEKFDLDHLRNYKITQIIQIYDLDASVLGRPTVESAPLRRGFVRRHRCRAITVGGLSNIDPKQNEYRPGGGLPSRSAFEAV